MPVLRKRAQGDNKIVNGLFIHSNPPRVLQLNSAYVRQLIRHGDVDKLEQAVLEGQGKKLIGEYSADYKTRTFLKSIPALMSKISLLHDAVNSDRLDELKSLLDEEPEKKRKMVMAKDESGVGLLHKAVYYDLKDIYKWMVDKYPQTVHMRDSGLIKEIHCDVQNDDLEKLKERVTPPIPPIVLSGKDINGLSPLHKKQKTAAYYKTRHSEIDSKLLNVIPDCPRSAKESLAANFDWNMLTSSPSMNWIQNGVKKAESMLHKSNDDESENATNGHDGTENGSADEPVENGNHEPEETNEEQKEETPEASNDPEEPDPPKEEPEPEKSEEEPEPEESKVEPKAEQVKEEPVPSSPGPVEPEHEPEPEHEQEPEPEESKEEDTAPDNNNSEETEDKNEPEVEREVDKEEEEVIDSNNNGTEADDEKEAEHEEVKEEEKSQSRPASNTTRPNSSKEATTRPNSVKSRPSSSHIEDKSRPSSKTSGKLPPVEDGEGIIEGVVHGEDEIDPMDNEGMNEPRTSDNNEDVKVLVETGNMEQLAALVLNGEGDRLVGMTSDNPELQTFLENVPTYMSKIHRIHEAARSGSLRDLQAALDRRKFAIAKDSISPKGASPLHVAVVFGNTSIVRYLAGRFPETLQMVDDEGRTPLHYAAVLNDNGHYYNLLVHLGADMRVDDNQGFSPEYYRKNQQDFNHRSLLRDFGAEEDEAEEILADKVPNDVYSARKNLDDEDMLAVLERCYNVLQSRRGSTVSTTSASTISSTSTSGFFLSKHVRRHIFDIVKLRLTKQDNNLYDIIWPSVKKLPIEPSFRVALEQDFPMGVSAPDFYSYHVFKEFLDPILKDYNHLNIYNDLPDQPQSSFSEKDGNANTDFDRDLDPQLKYILSGTLEASRNIEGFELPKSLNTGQLELVERIITTVLMSKEVAKALYPLTPEREIEEKGSGTYYTMNEVLEDTSEAKVVLASNGLLIPLWNIPDSDRLHGKYWPYGRGVFVSNGANLAVWVNVLDHIRIITCTDHAHPANVGQVFSRVSRLVGVLHQHLNFVFDKKLGFLSARPSAIGNTLQYNLTLRFPHLIKEPENLRHLCTVRSLTYHRNTSTTDVVRIGNQQCLGVTETQGFEDFTMAVANILQLEKDLAMSNSMHIAAAFLNIFKKKKLAESA
ncbi:unnamed protein product [Diabrotica balteata]|uniref:Arginine kinase n=1 Tax=Diabrotica balteata TaxID=107213 RepID=A0A9N9T001_DIABA|nr:unnamed protein product [Diabrotica balteata]